MVAIMNTSSLYPPTWPLTPFHAGEIEVQKRLGVQEYVNSYAPRVVRPYMPDQHRAFFTAQPFLVVAARDSRGMMWSSLLFASDPTETTDFITSPDATSLVMESKPLPGDALEGELEAGSDIGIIGIEFATRRRNRVNGRVVKNDGEAIVFGVDQAFGNCPQYIKSRDWWTRASSQEQEDIDHEEEEESCIEPPVLPARLTQLSPEQGQRIADAETIFLATGFRGEGEDPRYGNDASHRGGAPGFMKVVEDGKKILIPDYSGNNHFNTIGNLVKDPRMGIVVPFFDTGGLLQLSGRTTICWDEEESAALFPGALRVLEFTVDEVVELPAESLPIQWQSGNDDLQLQVAEKVVESADVTSFYLAPIEGELPSFKPGQHIPITMRVGDSEQITRNYSLSSFDDSGIFYRISVKRDPFGVGSRHLHDNVHAGDILGVQKPAGDFVMSDATDAETLLLLSAGIGVTPILSMIHSLRLRSRSMKIPYKRVVWIHTARNGKLHAFKNEAKQLAKSIGDRLTSYVVYTRPTIADSDFDYQGRMTAENLANFLEPVEKRRIDAFICGPGGFVASMEDHLQTLGVGPDHVHSESF
jgi:ferredoxin-NADP reductase/predicted pyridoxine 5'-phosphate oxidase superfamily flavin-nucleotide-binding protein